MRNLLSTLVAFLLVSCAPAGPGRPSESAAPPAAPKRITGAVMTIPITVFAQADAGAASGVDVLDKLVNSGLSGLDGRPQRVPLLAEAVPSVENSLWKVLPDGTMETTWRIRPDARWHDGTPVTSDDLLLAVAVGQDRELARFVSTKFRFVANASAPDAHTITVRWKQPYIGADEMFDTGFAPPLPRHLLEPTYRDNKAGWENLAYWSTEFVGTGPFRVGDWVSGSHLTLQAFDQYLLGRPSLDSIEVRFIPDGNTLIANVLAGAVEMTLGRGISVEQSSELDRWPDGRVVITPYNVVRAFWQGLTPDPALIGTAQFRRALLQAVDREELNTTLGGGLTPPAYSMIYPGSYPEIEARLPRYPFDVRAALAQLETLGYRPGPDQTLRNAAGQGLTVDISTSNQDFNQKPAFAMGDYWKRIGFNTTVGVVSPLLQGNEKLKFEAERPGFTVIRGSPLPDSFNAIQSSEARLPEKGYNGANRGRYLNPDLDALIDRYAVTIPLGERMQVLALAMQLVADDLPLLPLIYGADPAVIGNRLVNVGPRPSSADGRGNPAWNAHQWDVK